MSEPRLWIEMTAPELRSAQERGAVVLLPVGAVEQHGPHLPVDTDISGAYETAKEVSRRLDHVVVAPPVWWGLSGAHRGFAGLLTLRPQTFYELLLDLSESIVEQGFHKLILVVGHASNKPVVSLLVSQFMERRGVALMQLNYLELSRSIFQEIRKSEIGGDAHAGELETAVQMHLRPGRINPEGAPVRYLDPVAQFGHSAAIKDIFGPGEITIGYDLSRSFPDGVMGDPTVATAETGRRVWEAITSRACELVEEYRLAPISPETDEEE